MNNYQKYLDYLNKCSVLGLPPTLKCGTSGDSVVLLKFYSKEHMDFYQNDVLTIPTWIDIISPNAFQDKMICSKVAMKNSIESLRSIFTGISTPDGNLDLTDVNFSETTDIDSMFRYAAVKHIKINLTGATKLKKIREVFTHSSIKSIDIEFGENIRDISGLFAHCSNLKKLDLSKCDTRGMETMVGAFNGCINLETILGEYRGCNPDNITALFASDSKLEDSKFIQSLMNRVDINTSCRRALASAYKLIEVYKKKAFDLGME